MPSYRKRGDVWRAEIARSGVRESKTFDTKREAVEWATAREAELSAVRSGKVRRWTVREVLEKYAKEISPTKAGERWEKLRLAAIIRDPGNAVLMDMAMQDVQPADLAAWRDRRLKQVQPASVLRELATLRAVWGQAARGEWRFTDNEPWKEVTRPPEGKPRTVVFKDGQPERIVEALGYKGGQPTNRRQEAAVALLLSLETAMRAGEIIGLTWENVYIDRRIVRLPQTKNGDARDVPLSRRAVELLECMKGRDETRVFTLSSQLLDAYYRSGRTMAGIEGPTFHDARATALTRLSKKLDILELARMVGHRDPRSLMVYYRKSATEIAEKLD